MGPAPQSPLPWGQRPSWGRGPRGSETLQPHDRTDTTKLVQGMRPLYNIVRWQHTKLVEDKNKNNRWQDEPLPTCMLLSSWWGPRLSLELIRWRRMFASWCASTIPMEIVSPKELLGPHECCPYATRRPPHPYSTFGITWPDEAPSDMGQLPAPFFPGRKRHMPAFGGAISSARRHTAQRSCPPNKQMMPSGKNRSAQTAHDEASGRLDGLDRPSDAN